MMEAAAAVETCAAVETRTAVTLERGNQCRGTGPIVVCDQVAHSGNIGQIIRLCCNVDARQLLLVRDPRKKFSMNLTTLTSKFSAIN